MYIRINAGEGQGGKTTFTAKDVKARSQEEMCVLATHPFNLVYGDLELKLKLEGIDAINPSKIKDKTRKKLLKGLQQKENWEDGYPVFAGLNNLHFWDKMESFISTAKTRHKTIGYIDEFDNNQIGFEDYRVKVQKDDWNQDIVDQKKFNQLDLTSATTVGALISNLEYDEINYIKPFPGYNDQLNYNQVTDVDLDYLRKGNLRDNIRDGIQNCQYHSMINVDTSTNTHRLIAETIHRDKLTTVDGRLIVPVIVNENNPLNYDLVSSYDKYSCVYIGGQMFARGVTFPHLQNLIIDKPHSDIPTLIQAVIRIFGKKDYQIKAWCTSIQQDKIEEGRRLEDKIRAESILELPYEARKEWIENQNFSAKAKIINSKKHNNFSQHQERSSHLPIEMYRTLPTDLTSYCILSRQVDGSPPMGKTRRRGLTNFGLSGKQRKLSNQEKAEEFQQIIDRHPQVGTLIGGNWGKTNELHVQYMVPPYVFEYKDDNNNVYVEKQLAEQGDDWEDHWHIKTVYDKIDKHLKADNKPFVVSSSSRKGFYNVWHNLNALPDDAKLTDTTKVRKK